MAAENREAVAPFGGNIWTSTDSGASFTEDTSVGEPKSWRFSAMSADGKKVGATVDIPRGRGDAAVAAWIVRGAEVATRSRPARPSGWLPRRSRWRKWEITRVTIKGTWQRQSGWVASTPWLRRGSSVGLGSRPHRGGSSVGLGSTPWLRRGSSVELGSRQYRGGSVGLGSTSWPQRRSSVDASTRRYTGGGIFFSDDTGVTFRETSAPIGYWHGVAMTSAGDSIAAVMKEGRIWRSTDAAATWTASGPKRNWAAIAMTSSGDKRAAAEMGNFSDNGYAGGSIWLSTDSGQRRAVSRAVWVALAATRIVRGARRKAASVQEPGRGAAAGATWVVRGRVAAPPRVPRGSSVDGPRWRRGCHVNRPWNPQTPACSAPWSPSTM